jgi:hypothetical protein
VKFAGDLKQPAHNRVSDRHTPRAMDELLFQWQK